MSNTITNNFDSKTQILQYLSLIIGRVIFKYNFFGNPTDNIIFNIISNGLLSVIVGLVFLNFAQDYLEKSQFENLSGLFICYFTSLYIADYLYKIENHQGKITNAIKETALNFIIFAGLATIYNIVINKSN